MNTSITRHLLPFGIVLCAGALPSQTLPAQTLPARALPVSLSPATRDLPHASKRLFMESNARLQQFYERSEVGRSRLRVRELSLRFDGPTSGGASVAHTIGEFEVLVGVTERGVDDVTAEFDDNLTEPLQQVFLATSYPFHTDGSVGNVGPWGGAAGALRFVFPAPLDLTIPRHGSLVVEFRVTNNSNGITRDAARLDFGRDRTPRDNTRAISEGVGCWHGASMQVQTTGQYDPGTAFFVSGSGFPANTPVALLVTPFLIEPLQIPNTMGCWLYVDITSGFMMPLRVSDATGSIAATSDASGVPLPRAPRLRGSLLYVQAVAPLQPGSPYGSVLTSNYRTVKVGAPPAPRLRAWSVSSSRSATARIADHSAPGALAVRFR